MSSAAISTTGMAALATSAAAAVLAAGLREVGGAGATEQAWTGESTPDQKERLRGSFVRMKDGRAGYIPVSSRAAIIKEFTDGPGSGGTKTPKLKILFDGSENGSYFSAVELEGSDGIDRVWLGVVTVGEEAGAMAGTLRVGDGTAGVAVRLRPLPAISGALADAISTVDGIDRASVDLYRSATACGHDAATWQVWAGAEAVEGTWVAVPGVSDFAQATRAALGLDAAGLGGASARLLLSDIG
jgi:hypothetical protein